MSYKKICKIGEGTYGRVYHALPITEPGVPSPVSGPVAIKRNLVSRSFEGTIGSLRELDLLTTVKGHPYCITLKEVIYGSPFVDEPLSPANGKFIDDSAFFVFEKGDCDGEAWTKKGSPLINERKLYCTQLLLAVEFIHSRGIYHRDLKPSNVICFLTEKKKLLAAKITDFGLSQHWSRQVINMEGFVTLWYRAPEISLAEEYDFKVDIWSLGCILFECFSNKKLLTPKDDAALLNAVFKLFGGTKSMQSKAKLLYKSSITRAAERPKRTLEELLEFTESQKAQFNSSLLDGELNFGSFDEFVELLSKMLLVDKNERWTASQCLNHRFFDRVRGFVNRTRWEFGINEVGERVVSPELQLVYSPSVNRREGMDWFRELHEIRHSLDWYTNQIFFHAIEMFDRYLFLTDPPQQERWRIVVWINTFLFSSAKYFRVLTKDLSPYHFVMGVRKEDEDKFVQYMKVFEQQFVERVFEGEVFKETVLDVSTEYLIDEDCARLFSTIASGQVAPFTPLKELLGGSRIRLLR